SALGNRLSVAATQEKSASADGRKGNSLDRKCDWARNKIRVLRSGQAGARDREIVRTTVPRPPSVLKAWGDRRLIMPDPSGNRKFGHPTRSGIPTRSSP